MSELYQAFLSSPTGICTDTRKLEPGCMFFALSGENFDGNKFGQQAIDAGAKYAVVSDPSLKGDGFILVDDTLEALQSLAREHRETLGLPIIGITGSNGKTSTKELVREVLSQKYSVGCTQGNLNNQIGVPLTLLSFDERTEIGIVEMGANYPDEIAELCAISLPDHGIVTNCGKAHIEGFGSFENIIRTKTALYRSVASRGKGTIIYNADDPILTSHIPEGVNTLTYGQSENENISGEIVSSLPFLSFRVKTGGQTEEVNTHLFGAYNMLNALAATTAGVLFDVPLSDCRKAIEAYQPNMNRSQVVDTGNNIVVLDAYNANPSSMSLALREFASMDSPRLAILGDMLELGPVSAEEHQNMISLAQECADESFFVGTEFQKQASSQYGSYFADTKELMAHLSSNPLHGHRVLVKGSRGIKLEDVMEKL